MSRLVLGAARAGPVLLAIDDADVIDDASAALLADIVAAAAHAAEGAPVHLLTLVTYRPRSGSPAARRALDRLGREARRSRSCCTASTRSACTSTC